jgi:hypothetical protein
LSRTGLAFTSGARARTSRCWSTLTSLTLTSLTLTSLTLASLTLASLTLTSLTLTSLTLTSLTLASLTLAGPTLPRTFRVRLALTRLARPRLVLTHLSCAGLALTGLARARLACTTSRRCLTGARTRRPAAATRLAAFFSAGLAVGALTRFRLRRRGTVLLGCVLRLGPRASAIPTRFVAAPLGFRAALVLQDAFHGRAVIGAIRRHRPRRWCVAPTFGPAATTIARGLRWLSASLASGAALAVSLRWLRTGLCITLVRSGARRHSPSIT